MISEPLLDQAALYALGLLDDQERAEFEALAAADSRLAALAVHLQEAAAALAFAAAPGIERPSPNLRARILDRLKAEAGGPRANRAVPPRRSAWSTWIPWTLTAAAVGSALLSAHFNDESDRRRMSAVADRTSAVADRQALLVRLAVCPLEPTDDHPTEGRATVLWDPARRQGELRIAHLTPPGADHDYQLWAVVAGEKDPVSAGLVHVSPDGVGNVEFQPAGTGSAQVQAFALSLEPAGGSEHARGPIVLAGKL